MASIFDKYLIKLGVTEKNPSLEALKEITRAHLSTIPFENISKLYYLRKSGLQFIPDFDTYMEGITKFNFGGTCYSNNYYLNKLLEHFGYDVRLCGADMKNPDVHIVNIVKLEGRDYLVDMGYASPFLDPIPLDLNSDYTIECGTDQYVICPKDDNGFHEIKFLQNGQLKHGYLLKPHKRDFSEFKGAISDSFSENATFLNALLINRFEKNYSIAIRNFTITVIMNGNVYKRTAGNKEDLINQIVRNFKMPEEIVEEIISNLEFKADAFD